ncbi:hypothetical protein OS493_024119 [Desmophyllum pertusum]|uniref:Carbonic anhydrase n=1 Tax=Desmophyllum pertusum TaxID=174260 RepID=A0A9W9ZDH8_9CNID|nr:hypothetical protein OS493_024119 [Desmophyllum pertusum]
MAAFCPKCTKSSGPWSYHSPEGASTWKHHYPNCSGHKQSPVNIVPKETIYEAGLADLTINYATNVSAQLQNNGHSVQATFSTGKSNISGGGLPSRFRAAQMHFHWGSENSRGSEHQIAGRKYPMEVHIVHYNVEKYPNVSTAMTEADGLAVLGILVEVQARDNPVLDVIVERLAEIPYKYDHVGIHSLEPLLFIPHDFSQYYTYKGSLTTPDVLKACNVQPLNGRSVTRSFKRPPFVCGKTSNTTMACLGLADDKAVFYEATVNVCTLPAIVTLEVSQPDIGFNFAGSFYTDIKPPRKIGNLDYGFSLEMHSHVRETDLGTLHVSISQVHPLSTNHREDLVSADFKEDVCQLGRCIAPSCNKHWCDGTAIGFNNDTLYIGFSSTFRDLTAANPSVDVNFYRNESGTWHRTASETFANNEEKRVHLMGTFVDSHSSVRRRRMSVESSQWEFVTFKAKISKASNKVLYQLLMVPSAGLYYRVLKDEYTLGLY